MRTGRDMKCARWSMTLEITCAHCHEEYDLGSDHNCTPECIHCGATYSDLDDPEYDSAKISVSRHQRECEERPESWGEPIRDPEGEFREERRERKRTRLWEEKQRKRGHVW